MAPRACAKREHGSVVHTHAHVRGGGDRFYPTASIPPSPQASQAAESSGDQSRERQGQLRQQLTELHEQLSASKMDQRQSERDRRSAEALENLTRLFPGVHGRMLDICKPTQRRFNAAVTIAMGKNMDAVVVAEEKVAIECIKYLKDKKCPPETFIPLDTIRTKPLPERMRQLGGTKKPVVDVITVPEQFERAVHYAVGDTLVCDTLDEARQLCYHSGPERYKVRADCRSGARECVPWRHGGRPRSAQLLVCSGLQPPCVSSSGVCHLSPPCVVRVLFEPAVCRPSAPSSHGSVRLILAQVVTQDGSLINKAGLMTGGSSSSDTQRTRKWNQKEYETLKRQACLGECPACHERQQPHQSVTESRG